MKKNFLYLIISSIILLFVGCTQTLPEIRQANASIIFDYKDDDTFPDSRLSVFVQSNSNINRYETMKVASAEPEFLWESSDLARLSFSKKNFVGYTNFVLPAGIKLPLGNYSVIYENADEEQAELSFNIDYDLSLYETKSTDVENKIKEKQPRKKIEVFDAEKTLIYFGDYTFSSKEEIKRKLHDASTFRMIFIASNGNLICIMPVEKL